MEKTSNSEYTSNKSSSHGVENPQMKDSDTVAALALAPPSEKQLTCAATTANDQNPRETTKENPEVIVNHQLKDSGTIATPPPHSPEQFTCFTSTAKDQEPKETTSERSSSWRHFLVPNTSVVEEDEEGKVEGYRMAIEPSWKTAKSFCFRFPSERTKKHKFLEDRDVNLCIESKTWKLKYIYDNFYGWFVDGWKEFVGENFLEESDVCILNLVSQTSDSFDLEVEIIRAEKDSSPSQVA